MQPKQCSCGSDRLFRSPPIASFLGAESRDLLPGLSKLTSPARFTWVVCKDCGLGQFYATRETLERIDKTNGWRPLI